MRLPIPILLLLVTTRCATAQLSPPSVDDSDKNPYGENFNATTAILIVVVVSGFFFLAFFSLYFRRCSWDRSAVTPAVPGGITASGRNGSRGGLDPALIEMFPILTYSAVTGLKIGREALECAVCLSEFAGDDTLRMLPKCCHVFHRECVDTWLQSHVTCPVCRANLSVGSTEGEGVCPEIPGPEVQSQIGEDAAMERERMGRSHSVGHARGGVDRFTLRLPEHVRREIVQMGSLRRSASMAVFRGGGEGSSRRGYRGFWTTRSDRWATGILARVSTWRRGEAEGSTKKEAAEVSLRGGIMFNCLGNGGGGGRASDVGESSASFDAEKTSTEVLDRV